MYLIVRSQYRKGLAAAARGDLDGLLRQFRHEATLTFAGDTPLGAESLSGPDLRAWFERFFRLLPERRFEIQRLAVSGPPWNQQLGAHVLIRAVVDGEAYQNQFGHFLRLRWGKVVEDIIVEDTQRWARACDRLVVAGVAEAGAPPLAATR